MEAAGSPSTVSQLECHLVLCEQVGRESWSNHMTFLLSLRAFFLFQINMLVNFTCRYYIQIFNPFSKFHFVAIWLF